MAETVFRGDTSSSLVEVVFEQIAAATQIEAQTNQTWNLRSGALSARPTFAAPIRADVRHPWGLLNPVLYLAPRNGHDLCCRHGGQDLDLVELGAGLGDQLDVVGHRTGGKGEFDPAVR